MSPEVELVDDPRESEDSSASQMIGLCMVGVGTLLLLGLVGLWAGGAFNRAPIQPNQPMWPQQAPPQIQPAAPTESADEPDAPTPEVTPEEPVKAEPSKPGTDEQKLDEYFKKVTAIGEGKMKYDDLKPILKWIMRHSKWAIQFENNNSWWQMTHDTRPFFNRETPARKNRESIKAKARSIAMRYYRTKKDVGKVLWVGSGHPQRIIDIYIIGEKIAKRLSKWNNETFRMNWTQFASYFHNVKELRLALKGLITVTETHLTKSGHAIRPSYYGPEKIKYYQTKTGDIIFKHDQYGQLSRDKRTRLVDSGFKPGPFVVGNWNGECQAKEDYFIPYLCTVNQTLKDIERMGKWGNYEWAITGCSALFAIFLFLIAHMLFGFSVTDAGKYFCFFPFVGAMAFSFREHIRRIFYS